jgi:hypothetical protein
MELAGSDTRLLGHFAKQTLKALEKDGVSTLDTTEIFPQSTKGTTIYSAAGRVGKVFSSQLSASLKSASTPTVLLPEACLSPRQDRWKMMTNDSISRSY